VKFKISIFFLLPWFDVGIESGIDTLLVLTGITTREDLRNKYAFKPTLVLEGIADLLKD
jgi:ribonucleotide monophosphatase NagD (HAD superfamily)